VNTQIKMEKNNLSKELQESLKRHRELLGYDPTKGTSSLNEVRDRHSYLADNTDYAEGDEEETEEEGGDNPDFDFGGDEGGEEEGAEGFGDEETGGEEEEAEGFGDEGGEEETDEFGTADEFSAADDIEAEDEGEEVEEIDVTDIVKKSEDAKSYSEKAVKAAEEGKNMIQDLMTKFEALQSSLSKIDTVSNEIQSIKKDIQSQKPKEKLELRSLDSYPFNVKLTDYWNDEKVKSNYEINGGTPDAESPDGEVKVWKLDPNEAKDYSNVDIKKSFVPESKTKKKVLTENDTVNTINKTFSGLAEGPKYGKVSKIIQYLVQDRESDAIGFASGNKALIEELKKYLSQIPADKIQILKKKSGEEIQKVFSSGLKALVDHLSKKNLI